MDPVARGPVLLLSLSTCPSKTPLGPSLEVSPQLNVSWDTTAKMKSKNQLIEPTQLGTPQARSQTRKSRVFWASCLSTLCLFALFGAWHRADPQRQLLGTWGRQPADKQDRLTRSYTLQSGVRWMNPGNDNHVPYRLFFPSRLTLFSRWWSLEGHVCLQRTVALPHAIR